MNRVKKIICGIFITLTAFFFACYKVEAGSLNVYASTTSPIVGSSVIITIKAPDLAGNFSVTSSNGSILSGGTSAVWIDNETMTFTFRANGVGTATVNVVPKDVADYSTGSAYTTSKSVTITVKAKPIVILSSNNNLSSLGVDGVVLTPEFNADTLEYSTEMEAGTTKINITGTVADRTASLDGLGEKDVVEGTNRFEIKVTAQNGVTKVYVINVNVKEYNPIEVAVEGKTYNVVRKRTELQTPANYTETTVKIGEEEVPACYGEITKYTLIGLKDSEGKIAHYIYDATNNTYTKYQEFAFQRINFYPIEKTLESDYYQKSVIVLDNVELPVYKIKETSKFSLIYGMNVETSEEHWYLYNSEENTLQMYSTEEIDLLKEENKLYLQIGLILGGISILLLFILIIVICKKSKSNRHGHLEKTKARHKNKIEKKQEDLEFENI